MIYKSFNHRFSGDSAYLIRFFVLISGGLLCGTAIAKFLSANGSARILQSDDPIFSLSFHDIFLIAGVVELVVGSICLFSRNTKLCLGLIAWLATNFTFYHMGLLLVDYTRPCHCLGNLTDALHLSPYVADVVTKAILAYLLVGSYGSLFWLWRKKDAFPH